tara:strand:+ start:7874 stop:8209 length:336 start_codon:yes stop_codon:yes gene_type:complete
MPNIPYKTDYKHTRVFRNKNKTYSRPEHAKLYNNSRWRKLRAMFYKRNPLCVHCKNNDRLREGNVVDHIIPISDGGEFYSFSNLQTLCTRCHAIKTQKEVAERKRRATNNK